MKLGFTGTQEGATENQILLLIKFFNYNIVDEFHHGDCIGADAQAHAIALQEGCRIVIHPPKNHSKRAWCNRGNISGCTVLPEEEYLTRNRLIVASTDVLIAMPRTMTEEQRSGTWSTVRYARKMRKTVHILNP